MRRTQLRETVNALDLEASDPPLIVGGDFNAAGGDAIFRLFKGRLKDAFKEAGLGWGNTAINVCPVARPDQVWVGRRARSLRSWVKVTEHSDHRMVLCDLAVPLSR